MPGRRHGVHHGPGISSLSQLDSQFYRLLARVSFQSSRPAGGRSLIPVLLTILVVIPQQDGNGSTTNILRAAPLPSRLEIDGRLDEDIWAAADVIPSLTMIDPVEGGPLTGRTIVRVLAGRDALVIGVEALDPNPNGIVSFSTARDPDLDDEDYFGIVLDPFLDGRSGYVFAVNPRGARYDALIINRGEDESKEWDAVWEAATSRNDAGWTAEIRIPIRSLAFDASLREWGFNAERRLARLQEVSRWASPTRDIKVTYTSRAGRLVDLPQFSTGWGLTVRPAIVTGFEHTLPGADPDGVFEPSLDIQQRLSPNVSVIGTLNTDFADTEVDTRQTNTTRFSLFFPEKRTFFLEGSDIFDFGIGLSAGFRRDLVPFFTRRIGLYEDQAVPLSVGGKLNGKVNRTNFGALVTRTGSVEGLVPATTMGAVRIRQNVLDESTVGALTTFGDPTSAGASYTAGADFTFQTSKLGGDKLFQAGIWALTTNRDGLSGDRTAVGGRIAYPNDTWNVGITAKRIGDGFDPSLGFVPRRGIYNLNGDLEYTVRPQSRLIRAMFHEFRPSLVLDLDGKWESYRIFMAPINWRLESGDRFEFNIIPQGERLDEPFEIADGVSIPVGGYDFMRYRLEVETAAKRVVNGQVTWWFGQFYDGTLNELELELSIKPIPEATVEASIARNTGKVSAGSFTQAVYGGRASINLSPDLQITSFVQYDNESRQVGTNSRLRWTFNPYGDLFVVYNHNWVDLMNRWQLDSNQLVVKLQYTVRR